MINKRLIKEMREDIKEAKSVAVKEVQRQCTRGTTPGWGNQRVLEKAVCQGWQILQCNENGRTEGASDPMEYGDGKELPTRKMLDGLWEDVHPDTTELVIEGMVYTVDEAIRPIEDMWELIEPAGHWWTVILETRTVVNG